MTQEWKRSVARVWADDADGARHFIGSAFLVWTRQLITCRHVLDGHDSARIYVSGPPWTGVHRISKITPQADRDVCLIEVAGDHDCIATPLEPWIRPPGIDLSERDLTLAGYTSPEGALETPTMRLRAYDGVLNTWVLHTHLSRGFSGGPALIGDEVFGVVQARELDGSKTYVIPVEALRDFLQSNGIWKTLASRGHRAGVISSGVDPPRELTRLSLSLFSDRHTTSSATEIVTLPPRRLVVGRSQEIELAEDVLQHSNMVLLVGGRGVGKSAVGLELAHRAHERSREGARGAYLFFSCRSESYGRDELCDALALQLDYLALANASGPQKRALVLQLLGKARFPIVLLVDDFESLGDRQEEVLEFLRSLPSSTRVIVTTSERRQCMQTVAQVEVPGMREQESIAFLRSEITHRKLKGLGSLDELFLSRIHLATGGNPLVMQWILGQASQGHAVDSVLSFLESGMQETISSKLFSNSWAAMSETARRVLALTTLFSKDTSMYLLRRLLDTDGEHLFQAVDEVQRYCVAEMEPGGTLLGERITVHPLVTHFARNNSIDKKAWLDEKRIRLVEVYVELLRDNREVVSTGGVVREVERELQNILWLIDRLRNEGNKTASAELSLAIEDFLNLFGLYDVRIRLSRSAADHFKDVGMYDKASHMLTVAAGSHLSRGEYKAATELAITSCDLAIAAKSDGLLSRALRVIGIVQFRLCEDDAARATLSRAWPLAECSGDLEALSELCFLEANLALARSAYAEVRVALARALEFAGRIGWRRPTGYAAGLLARAAMEEGKMDEAMVQLEIGEKTAIDYADRRLLGRISLLYCSALARLGAYKEFRHRLAEVVDLLQRLGMVGELQEAEAQLSFWSLQRRFFGRLTPWVLRQPPVRYAKVRLDGI